MSGKEVQSDALRESGVSAGKADSRLEDDLGDDARLRGIEERGKRGARLFAEECRKGLLRLKRRRNSA